MRIQCTQCGAAISAEDVNLDDRLAKCRSCNNVFDFSDQIKRSGAPASPSGRAKQTAIQPARPNVPLPSGIRVVEDTTTTIESGDYRTAAGSDFRLVLTRSWFTFQLFFLAFFCIAWDSFLVFWYFTAATSKGPVPLLMIIFPIAHVAVGVGLTYSTLAGFLNKSWITLTPEALTIRHGPLPWLGNCRLASSDIRQLFCEQATSRGRNSSTTYTLSAVLSDGRKVPLLKSLPSQDQALYIEQRVETCLGIEDARVGGEYTP